jgi:hypothetical protein
VCTDADNDGQTDCAGDCDDTDPLTYQGAAEICGDGIDNDCNGTPDDVCGGIGTYVSELTGDDLNPGTKDKPVKTIGKGMQNAQTIMATTNAPIDVYVAEGTYTEKVTMVEDINLVGGYSCTAQPCTWDRDPKLYDSKIVDTDFQGVLAGHTVTRATRIDGFTITGKSGDPGSTAPGTVALTVAGGTPTIVNNTITAGDAVTGAWPGGRSVGIAVLAPANDTQGVAIDGNTISAGKSENTASIGVMFWALPGQVGKTYGLVVRNTITGGPGNSSAGIEAWTSGTGTVIRNNDIQGGEAEAGGAWGINIGSIALIDGNRINLDPNAKPKCQQQNWCGGIHSPSSTTVIINNVIAGADAPRSAGVRLAELETPAGAVVLSSNSIDGGGSTSSGSISAAVQLEIGGCCGQQTLVGRVSNNILLGGVGQNQFGIFEAKTGGKQAHPEMLQNNDFFVPSGILYAYWDGATASALNTEAAVNGLAQKLGPVSGNISADPSQDSSYHLQTGSPCIDSGTATDAPASDFEGDARPAGQGYDIGPDETP